MAEFIIYEEDDMPLEYVRMLDAAWNDIKQQIMAGSYQRGSVTRGQTVWSDYIKRTGKLTVSIPEEGIEAHGFINEQGFSVRYKEVL